MKTFFILLLLVLISVVNVASLLMIHMLEFVSKQSKRYECKGIQVNVKKKIFCST